MENTLTLEEQIIRHQTLADNERAKQEQWDVALANHVINYPTLTHLTEEQREYIGRVITAVEKSGPKDILHYPLCFKLSQALARWDYENGDRRIKYVEGCLVCPDETEPEYGTDVSRAGRYHHGYNSIDG